MNIRLELENNLTKSQINHIAEYACSTTTRFRKLMDIFLDENHIMGLRASWIVIRSIEINKSMLDPFITDLVSQITNPINAEHLIRNSLRILELLDIPEICHGLVMNTCFGFLEQPQTPIAIKAYSLTIVYRLSIIYPEIQDELACIIEENWDLETPAFKSRGKKILAQIKKSRKMN
jgi:hypothetical protein